MISSKEAGAIAERVIDRRAQEFLESRPGLLSVIEQKILEAASKGEFSVLIPLDLTKQETMILSKYLDSYGYYLSPVKELNFYELSWYSY